MSDIDKYVQQRADQARDRRQEVLQRLAEGRVLDAAPMEQTVRRLEYRGRPEDARRFEEARTAGAEPPSDVERFVREALVGTDETQPVRFLDGGAGCAQSIGRVVLEQFREPLGTGFLVSPRLLLTNQHVLKTAAMAAKSLVQFRFREGWDGDESEPHEFRLQPDLLFVWSDVNELDYALVAVEPVNEEGVELHTLGFNPLIGTLGKSQQGARVNIVHHPEGKPMKVSLRQNFLALMLDRFVHYLTDTSHGSSGSPVFNDEWEVVALHHGAVKANDDEVALYEKIVGKTSDRPYVNEGVRVSQIVGDLAARSATLVQPGKALYDELVEAAKTARPSVTFERSEPLFPATAGASTSSSTTSGPGHTVSTNAGAVTVTVTVSGAPVASPGAAPRADLDLELYQHTLSGQKSLVRGLRFLEQARERPYLPEASERRRRREEYYGDLPAKVANGDFDGDPKKLFRELSAIQQSNLSIVDAFPEPLVELESLGRLERSVALEGGAAYSRARAHLYTWCDLQEDRMLECVYTGAPIAPEQLMLKDMITQLDLKDELPPNFANNRLLNCEHIVPQSWFGKSGPAVSDMHHLISARGSANNFRSDRAYRDLGEQGEPGPANRPQHIPKAGWRGDDDTFEPHRKAARPVVARATLYFFLTHPGKVAKAKYDGHLDLLRAWADGKPSRYELHRNEAIFEAQGNRNPLIDFPEWAALVDFSQGFA